MAESKRRIPTVEPEHEPEYVGAHSEPVREECAYVSGESIEDLEHCGEPATHTVVERANGQLHEIPMCDSCGEPEDAQR